MSRGLGQLQKAILRIGFERSISGQNRDGVLARDILVEYYNFPFIRFPSSVRSGSWVFRKGEIGKKRYSSATVTVCQSFNRLVTRGLIEHVDEGYGYKLSPKGIKLSKTL